MSNILADVTRASEKVFKNKDEGLKELEPLLHTKEYRNILKEAVYEGTFDENLDALKTIITASQIVFTLTGNSTGLEDSEYDVVWDKLQKLAPNTLISVAVPKSEEGVFHKYTSLRGTLDKIYALSPDEVMSNKSRTSLDDWIVSSERRIYNRTGKTISLRKTKVICFPKFDGVSGIFEYNKDGTLDRVLTRGFTETNEAQEIGFLFKDITGPVKDKPYGRKTEIMMTNENFDKYNRDYGTNYKNSRSIVSSIINSKERDSRVDYLTIVPLRTSSLNDDGTETLQILDTGVYDYPYLECTMDMRDEMLNFAINHKVTNGLRCDGMVIYIVDPEIQKALGRENNKQKFEVAYKFTEEIEYSEITDVTFTTGLYGTINPVANFKSIKMKGNDVKKSSLGSMQRFMNLKLAKGDTIKILYDIIPYIVMDDEDPLCSRSGNKPVQPPTHCPYCGEQLVQTSKESFALACLNLDCPCRQKGKILNYLRKMHIDGLSYATIDTLYDMDIVKTIPDLYKIEKRKKEIIEIPGFGKKTVDMWLDEIDNNKEVTASNFLGSIGIKSIGRKVFASVLSMITFEELLALCIDDTESNALAILTAIPGIKDANAKKIIEGIKENKKLIEKLDKILIIKEEPKEQARFKVVFTKIRRPDLEELIKEHHGETIDNVTKDTDIVVIPKLGVTSGSTEKANKYGIPIVTVDDLPTILNTSY